MAKPPSYECDERCREDAQKERHAQEHEQLGEQHERVLGATRDWLERAVIGLRLCPFAAGVHLRGLIRYTVSEQRTVDGLVGDLAAELEYLRAVDIGVCETTLLIHPYVLGDFGAYNQFLDAADAAVAALDLEGVIQVASFHPDYRFAGTAADDAANNSNRSPYPMLHLLREESVTRAVAAFPDIGTIGERNVAVLRKLGTDGWRALFARR